MIEMNTNYLHSELTSIIIKAFYNVYNTLGYGFLEKVYENALMIELNKLGLVCEKQVPIAVYYEDIKDNVVDLRPLNLPIEGVGGWNIEIYFLSQRH